MKISDTPKKGLPRAENTGCRVVEGHRDVEPVRGPNAKAQADAEAHKVVAKVTDYRRLWLARRAARVDVAEGAFTSHSFIIYR